MNPRCMSHGKSLTLKARRARCHSEVGCLLSLFYRRAASWVAVCLSRQHPCVPFIAGVLNFTLHLPIPETNKNTQDLETLSLLAFITVIINIITLICKKQT